MVHLNLAIALLCGLIVFVSGVETATENEVKIVMHTYVKVMTFLMVFSIGWLYIGHLTFTLLLPGCFCLGIM